MRTLHLFLLSASLFLSRPGTTQAFVPHRASSAVVPQLHRPSSSAASAVSSDLLEGLPRLPNPFKALLEAPEAPLGGSPASFGNDSGEFDPSPSGLIRQAKRVLAADLGLQDAALLDDSGEFRWIGPVVDKPLGKRDYLAAGRFFDLRAAFPDLDYRPHDFRVDEADAATVHVTCRVTGTMRGELRLRNGVLQPTGQRMVCPPEAITIQFDLNTGQVVKLGTGFGLDRLVGNTAGTTGVMAAAFVAGQDVSDWEIYPPATCLGRFFGRPTRQLPETKAFLAPFPETVMVQLAKGVLAADMAAEDPTLLADGFTFSTPYVGPVRKGEFLDKYAREEFGGVDPTFSYFRVDPYDPVRVWVDVKPTAPGYEGAPQAMSFTFDDEGFCTRITSWAVMDPSVGNGGGLGGPEGFKYAVDEASPAFVTRPLPRSLGRLRKRALSPFTGIDVDDYDLTGGRSAAAATAKPSVPKKPTPRKEEPSTPLEKLSSLKSQAMPALKARQAEEQAEIKSLKADAERRLKEAQNRKAAAVAQMSQQARGPQTQRQPSDQKADAERKRKEAQAKQAQQLPEQKAVAERRRKEVQEKQAQMAAEKQRQLAEQKAETERRRKEAQEKQAQAAAVRQKQLAEQKAETERRRKEVQEQQAQVAAERQKQLAEQKAEAERRRREAQEKQAQVAAEKQRQLAERRDEVERKRSEAQERTAAAAATKREAQVAAEKQRQLAERRDEVERKRKEAQGRTAATAATERERQLAEKRAEAERKKREVEEARQLQMQAQQAEREALVEEQRLKQAMMAKEQAAAAIKAAKERRVRQEAALDAVSNAAKRASISLLGLGGNPEGDTKQQKTQERKSAVDAAAKAPSGASISLFGLGGKPASDVKSQGRKSSVDAVSKASPGATINLFGLGGGKSASDAEGRKRQEAQEQAAAAEARKRQIAEQKAEAERKRQAQRAEKERLAEERRLKQAAAAEQRKKELDAKKTAVEKSKRQKAAADQLSTASSGSTIGLFGLGGGKPDGGSLPLSKATTATKRAPPGVPTLTRWRKNGDGSVTGLISGSRNFPEGERVTTSPIAGGNTASGQVVKTGSGSRYFLS